MVLNEMVVESRSELGDIFVVVKLVVPGKGCTRTIIRED
jgi:hypothetical protein